MNFIFDLQVVSISNPARMEREAMFKELGSMINLMKNASKLKDGLGEFQQKIGEITAEGDAGGKMVTVSVKGHLDKMGLPAIIGPNNLLIKCPYLYNAGYDYCKSGSNIHPSGSILRITLQQLFVLVGSSIFVVLALSDPGLP